MTSREGTRQKRLFQIPVYPSHPPAETPSFLLLPGMICPLLSLCRDAAPLAVKTRVSALPSRVGSAGLGWGFRLTSTLVLCLHSKSCMFRVYAVPHTGPAWPSVCSQSTIFPLLTRGRPPTSPPPAKCPQAFACAVPTLTLCPALWLFPYVRVRGGPIPVFRCGD